MQEIISVIVPVHNSEKYLKKCLDSIINQSYRDLEIILVDDNSTDRSGIICDEYATRDSRIRVIHNINGGEGGAKARNVGINIATGSLFYFMDSDDYIESTMLMEMYNTLCREQSQCAVCSFHYVDESGNEISWQTPQLEEYHTMSGVEAAKIFLTTLNIEGFSWNKLFRREIIIDKNIRFDESLNSFVDMYGMFQAVLNSTKVSFCKQQFYYYRQRAASCVHTMSLRKLSNFRKVVEQITKKALDRELVSESQYFYTYRMMRQLFDAIKGKKGYNKQVWKQIKTEYAWINVFKVSVCKAGRLLSSYGTESRLKNSMKLFVVWYNFR